MKRGTGLGGGFAAAFSILFLAGGCALNPLSSSDDMKRASAPERDMLADAALAVETAPWPQPEKASVFSFITGGGSGDHVTRSDAVAIYVEALQPEGARFSRLEIDARANLGAADRLAHAARQALAAPRLTMNDVAMIEAAIQSLRENRQIYISAAKLIGKSGEPVSDADIDALRDAYAAAIRELGHTADALADRIDADRSENYAAPSKPVVNKLSGV